MNGGRGARRGRESLVDDFVTLVLFLLVLNPYRPGLAAVCPGEISGHSPGELIITGVCWPGLRHPVTHPQVCEQSCAALCVLALRKPENSRVIVEGGGAVAALEAMKAHPQEAGLQVGTWKVGQETAGGGRSRKRTSLCLPPSPS